ncbi:hypothetical protein DBV33_16850 [Pseudomonas fluorescens]|nr:hypothetical protein DBV33_16850 [Pseudomonas fluorescens]
MGPRPALIVPTLRVGMPLVTLCVTVQDAERPWLHSHAERGNDHLGSEPAREDRRHKKGRPARQIGLSFSQDQLEPCC